MAVNQDNQRPDKNKQTLARLLKNKYGEKFNPVDKMVQHAVKIDEMIQKQVDGINGEDGVEPDVLDRKTAVECWDKVAQYVQPKLKATEISGNLDTNIVKIIDLSGTPAKTPSKS